MPEIDSWVMIVAAFVGAMICMGFVILMSSVIEQMAMLIVSGVMIGYILFCSDGFIRHLCGRCGYCESA